MRRLCINLRGLLCEKLGYLLTLDVHLRNEPVDRNDPALRLYAYDSPSFQFTESVFYQLKSCSPTQKGLALWGTSLTGRTLSR